MKLNTSIQSPRSYLEKICKYWIFKPYYPSTFALQRRYIYIVRLLWFLFRAQEPKAPVTYCDHALSVVCRPSVRPSVRPLDYLHFQLLLHNRLMDFDETWYRWSTQGPLQVLLFFGQIRPEADPGRGQIGHGGSPSSKNFFFRTKGYSIKPNA